MASSVQARQSSDAGAGVEQAWGGEYFADNRLTVADLKFFADVSALKSGRLDHVPADLVEKVAHYYAKFSA